MTRILVAGVGNVFFGDDGFGVEVVRRLAARPLPDGVRVVDFGIRGLDLAYALLEGYDAVVLIDALQRGGPPGTLHVLEPGPADLEGPADVETHNLHPLQVLRLVRTMGGSVRRLRVVGCEPATLGSEEELVMGLSEPVRAAVDEAVQIVEALVAEFLRDGQQKD